MWRYEHECFGRQVIGFMEENKIQPKSVNNCHKGTKKSRTFNFTLRQSSGRGASVDPVPTITKSNNILLIQIRMFRKGDTSCRRHKLPCILLVIIAVCSHKVAYPAPRLPVSPYPLLPSTLQSSFCDHLTQRSIRRVSSPCIYVYIDIQNYRSMCGGR